MLRGLHEGRRTYSFLYYKVLFLHLPSVKDLLELRNARHGHVAPLLHLVTKLQSSCDWEVIDR